jgi:hypothetical protein
MDGGCGGCDGKAGGAKEGRWILISSLLARRLRNKARTPTSHLEAQVPDKKQASKVQDTRLPKLRPATRKSHCHSSHGTATVDCAHDRLAKPSNLLCLSIFKRAGLVWPGAERTPTSCHTPTNNTSSLTANFYSIYECQYYGYMQYRTATTLDRAALSSSRSLAPPCLVPMEAMTKPQGWSRVIKTWTIDFHPSTKPPRKVEGPTTDGHDSSQ